MLSLNIVNAVLLAATAAFAAPTSCPASDPSSTKPGLTGVTHLVVAGHSGLHFDPDDVQAQAGDVVEWHFQAANYSVAQSSFGAPCQPAVDRQGQTGFFSGFNFAVPAGAPQAENVFQIVVQDAATPLWYYCAQTFGANHCQTGMVGVINQNYSSPNSLAAYRAAAARTTATAAPPVQLPAGAVIENPCPMCNIYGGEASR